MSVNSPLTILTNDEECEPISTWPRLSTDLIITVKFSDSSAMPSSIVDTLKTANG